MATGGLQQVGYELINRGTLSLKDNDPDPDPMFTSLLILPKEMLMVVDNKAEHLRLYRRDNINFPVVTKRLARKPWDVCICGVIENDIQVAVTLDNGQIEIMSVRRETIEKVRTLDATRGFDGCYSVKYLKLEKELLLVSGLKLNFMCWGMVPLKNEDVVTVHKICKYKNLVYSRSFLATNPEDTVVYISFNNGDNSLDTGVYGFDITTNEKKFLYQDSDLKLPSGIAVDGRGSIYVSNYKNPPCIHQLTQEGVPITVHREGMPSELYAMYWADQEEELFVTRSNSKLVTRFQPQYIDEVIPAEVLKMDRKSLEMYKKALRDGKEKVYNIRVMVVGQYGVGKTTLTKRLLGKDVKISDKKSTDGIDVHVECCKVSMASGVWTNQDKNAEQYSKLQRLVKLLNEHVPNLEAKGKKECESGKNDPSAYKKQRVPQAISQPVQKKQTQSSSVKVDKRPGLKHSRQKTGNVAIPVNMPKSCKNKEEDATMEILQMVNKNAKKLEKSIEQHATLAVWDFAGQYIFYTTHQTFLTSRALYLLVIDLSQQVTNTIQDDQCFLNTEGIKQCKVHDLIEIWLNSIHSCAPSTAADIPPVILVGTHLDKIEKITKKSKQKVIDDYFLNIRYKMKGKPAVLHLVGDIAIDNTQHDQRLEDLKRMIFELASKQSHWGEEKPTRWLPLEQAIMKLKTSGAKVVPLSLVEEINKSGSVMIEKRDELDLFLRFHHEIGTILYFSVDGLSEKIVLDPQWMIDALKSLITAEMFIKKKPAIITMWCDFRDYGKLTHELIDALWTEEENPEFHHNKNHILLLMEQLNVITKPRSYSKDGKKIEMKNYFLAPCMLRQATPAEIISPELHLERESTSVLCYVFIEKFLPSPIFHRLLAACLTHWSIAKKMSEKLIFCGCCVFDVDPCHKLTLYLRDYAIFASVAKMSSKNKTPDLNICIYVRDFINNNLSQIIGSLCKNLKFVLHIQCSESKRDCLDSMFPVSKLEESENLWCSSHGKEHSVVSHDLLRFWFKDMENQDKDRDDIAFSVQPSMLDRKPTVKQLGRLSMKIGNEFFRLGLELGLSGSDIGQLQVDYPFISIQCLMILVKWKEKSRDSATFINLEKAFRSVDIDIDIPKTIFTTESGESCLPHEMLDKQPEERHLNQICHRIGKELVHLGVELEVPVFRIEQIRLGHPSKVQNQCLEIMKEWKKMKKKQATFRNLEQALKCVGIDPTFLTECLN